MKLFTELRNTLSGVQKELPETLSETMILKSWFKSRMQLAAGHIYFLCYTSSVLKDTVLTMLLWSQKAAAP